MSVTKLDWSADDITDAAKGIHALLRNLEWHKDAKRKHRKDFEYLQHCLLPKLRLIGGYVKDIDDSEDHPRKAEWNANLRTVKRTWQKLKDYLSSRNGLLPESLNRDRAAGGLPWSWDELSAQIEGARREVKDTLDDMDRLILLEICERFGLILPRLDSMFQKIEDYGECMSTYRKDVQEILCSIRSNKQDFKSLKNLFQGSMADLAHKISNSQSETEAIKSQLQAMSEKLERLLAQLAEQRGNCTTKTEKRYLDQLRKEVEKQAASVARLRVSVDETMGIMAEFLHALDKLDFRKGISHRASGAFTDMNDMLSKTISSLERLYESLTGQTFHVPFKKAKLWRRVRSTGVAPSAHDNGESRHEPLDFQPIPARAMGGEDNDPATFGTGVENQPAGSSKSADTALLETTNSMSTSTIVALPAPPSSSGPKSSRISIQDLTILLTRAPESMSASPTAFSSSSPPPLPRKSSARRSYQYVLRTLSPGGQTRPPPVPAIPAYTATPPPAPAQSSASSSLSEVDFPSPLFSALPSRPPSIDAGSALDITASHAAGTTSTATAITAAGSESAKVPSLLAQLERRYSLTVVTAST
ncbi:uncharacterized protein Z519_05877 [Cladophialophora bantiana CBS 173.52]|uniref:Uncharacterized protein n=1 Tax=Cladophialophora bantiana (strain ATCC 10958 / CBS 173.52 / CDC B-1940 / NIH 8579) TaxID=1442370 RepID=A0A0D2G3L9_CLAB1|nr:uncharacterized protein Z519_05877 [Cladophialophora bantiana CBS 173.52]KIW93272.1 hypothetical protein Z519_05877 [Cladophialophora bantiana CBS 173.52]